MGEPVAAGSAESVAGPPGVTVVGVMTEEEVVFGVTTPEGNATFARDGADGSSDPKGRNRCSHGSRDAEESSCCHQFCRTGAG